MEFYKKRALALFFYGASFSLLVASHSLNLPFWWLGLSLLMIPAWAQGRRFNISWSGLLLCIFSLLLLINGLYLNPVYHAQGVYFSATFLISFIFATRFSNELIHHGFRWFCWLSGLIALWALLQWLTGWGYLETKAERAQALFSTPNTFATAINLALAPLLAFYLLGRGSSRVLWLILLLFAGLLASQSRGGYLGLTAAMLFFMIYVGGSTISSNLRHYRDVLLGFAGVGAFFKIYAGLGLAGWSLDNVTATLRYGDSSYRWELYEMAWPLLVEHFWHGVGYFNFGYYFQMHKVAPFLDGETVFVHNDYLQLALEVGAAGIFVFLAVIVTIYVQLGRYRAWVINEQRLPVIMSVAAVTSMLAHALVDFPFYIPFLIAVFAAFVGVIDKELMEKGSHSFFFRGSLKAPGIREGFLSGLVLMSMLTWLGLPAFAEAAAAYGLNRLQHGDARWGLYWHEVARHLQSRESYYYWREGIILRDLGETQHHVNLIGKSDALFAEGVELNPFEVNNILARIALHRQYRELLATPASPDEIMGWVSVAKHLRPYSDAVQVEYIQCLAFAGQKELALTESKLFLAKRPRSRTAARLMQEMKEAIK